jgi:hypothetical protein
MITYEEQAEIARLETELLDLFSEFSDSRHLDGLGYDPVGKFFRGDRIA